MALSGVLTMQVPALVQFEGHPEVSATGDIVYVFPGLQRTARQQVSLVMPSHCYQSYRTLARTLLSLGTIKGIMMSRFVLTFIRASGHCILCTVP